MSGRYWLLTLSCMICCVAATSILAAQKTPKTAKTPKAAKAPKVSAVPLDTSRPKDADYIKASQQAWGKKLKLEVTEENSIGMEFALIPPGKFMMGGPPFVKTAVPVILTDPYYVGVTEVTQKQWGDIMGTEPWKERNDYKVGPDYPATAMLAADAVAFCEKLSAKEKQSYRLPTEAEWEFACRAGSVTRFYFGEDQSELADHAWYWDNAFVKGETYAHEVKLKKPNAFGLYDVLGNVREYCVDGFVSDLPGGKNPVTPLGDKRRTNRGGSWGMEQQALGSAARDSEMAVLQSSEVGFRVVRILSKK